VDVWWANRTLPQFSSSARFADSSIALPVGSTRKLTCRSPCQLHPRNEALTEVDDTPVGSKHIGIVTTSPASGTLFTVDMFVSSPEEHLGGQVSPQFTAEWARDGDGLEGEFIPARAQRCSHAATGKLVLLKKGVLDGDDLKAEKLAHAIAEEYGI
jgi:hypothetical protein